MGNEQLSLTNYERTLETGEKQGLQQGLQQESLKLVWKLIDRRLGTLSSEFLKIGKYLLNGLKRIIKNKHI
jgi:hypothetical protein